MKSNSKPNKEDSWETSLRGELREIIDSFDEELTDVNPNDEGYELMRERLLDEVFYEIERSLSKLLAEKEKEVAKDFLSWIDDREYNRMTLQDQVNRLHSLKEKYKI